MNKKQEKRIVEIADKEISKFAKDWLETPYVWETEADVHYEIVNRIRLALKRHKIYLLKAKYKGFKKLENFSRICCKPKVYYYKKDRSKAQCFPDIVIYKDIINPKKPPDEIEGINWPMLWVCEIKYKTDWSGDYQQSNRRKDLMKLECLLSQRSRKIHGTDYACHLDFAREKLTKVFYKRNLKSTEQDVNECLKKYKFIIYYKRIRDE